MAGTSNSKVRLAVHGAAGRMGCRLVALAGEDAELELVAALESPRHPQLGADAGTVAGVGPLGLPLSAELTVPADVIIDFSVPEAVPRIVEFAHRKQIPLVIATTGLSAEQERAIQTAAHETAILRSPNMSPAVNLLMKLCQIAARTLKSHPAGVDVEIMERHHRYKEDAPSGTALKFGQLIAEVMGQTRHVHGRQGRPGRRPPDEIGYHALRVGDNPGEHTIVFAMPGETVELSVRAGSRDCYAYGALAAAKFMVGKKPGIYTMQDVLRLE